MLDKLRLIFCLAILVVLFQFSRKTISRFSQQREGERTAAAEEAAMKIQQQSLQQKVIANADENDRAAQLRSEAMEKKVLWSKGTTQHKRPGPDGTSITVSEEHFEKISESEYNRRIAGSKRRGRKDVKRERPKEYAKEFE